MNGGNPAVPGNDEIVRRELAASPGRPSTIAPSAIAHFLGLAIG